MSEPRMAYVGQLPCGCIEGATVDDPDHKRDVAKFVAKMLRDGLTVTRRPSAELNTDPAFLRECGPGGRGHAV